MAITNPYIFGSPVKTKEMFFGREDVFAFLREHLVGTYQDNVVMLYGQRRTGKTSILYQLLNDRKILGENYVPVLISLEGLQDSATNGHVFWEIARKISQKLDMEKPIIEEFDAINSYFRDAFLHENVKPLLNQRKLLLMFDEYEVLEECVNNPVTNVNTRLFHQLRHLMQHYDWLSFLLVGSHKLEELNPNYWKEFTGAIYHTISFLDPKSARDLIEKPAEKFSVYYTLDAVQPLLQLSGNHPLFLQSLCHFAYSHRADKGKISIQDVEIAIELCIQAIQNLYASIWLDFKDDEKIILSAISYMDSSLSVSDIVELLDYLKVRREPNLIERIKRTIQQLEYKEVLKKTENCQYEYYVPLFRRCVKTYHPLEKVLDSLNIKREKETEANCNMEIVRAKNFIETAEGYVRTENFGKAQNTFNYVIDTYPDYIDGWLQFGHFYESREKWDNAIELYRKMLKCHPTSVDASNAIGLVLRKKNRFKQALEQFQFSLEIQRDNFVALANIQKIKQELANVQEFEQKPRPIGHVKINKLLPTLEKNRGAKNTFVITAKNLSITINGEIHKIDEQYCFTRGIGKIVIDQQKAGTLLSWKGTYKTYSVKFMVGENVLAEFEIPRNAKLSLDEIVELQEQ